MRDEHDTRQAMPQEAYPPEADSRRKHRREEVEREHFERDQFGQDQYGMEGNQFGSGGPFNSANAPQQGDSYGQNPFTDSAQPGGNTASDGTFHQGTDLYQDEIDGTSYAQEGNQFGTGGYTAPGNTRYDELGSQQTVFGHLGGMDPATSQAASPLAADPLTSGSAENGGSTRDQYMQQQRKPDGLLGGQDLSQYASGNFAPQEQSSGPLADELTTERRDERDKGARDR